MFGIIILFVIAGFVVQQRLKSKFKKYSKESLSNGMSGAEIAQKCSTITAFMTFVLKASLVN